MTSFVVGTSLETSEESVSTILRSMPTMALLMSHFRFPVDKNNIFIRKDYTGLHGFSKSHQNYPFKHGGLMLRFINYQNLSIKLVNSML